MLCKCIISLLVRGVEERRIYLQCIYLMILLCKTNRPAVRLHLWFQRDGLSFRGPQCLLDRSSGPGESTVEDQPWRRDQVPSDGFSGGWDDAIRKR